MAAKNRFWNFAACIFVAGVLVFGLVRARHEFRWSGWALGDAQNLNAAIHFADEGFREHYFLTYYHPGFLGKSFGNESQVGYYTRYPPLSAVWNGFLIKYFSATRACLKSAAVVLAGLALLFAYGAFSFFCSRRAAFFAMAVIGSSVGFLQFMDCLSPYLYSEFFRFSAVFFFLLAEKNREKPRAFIPALILVWMLVFLESFNSLDYILFLQIFFLLYWLISKREISLPKLSFLASAPVVGFALHYYQSHLALGEYGVNAAQALFKALPDKTAPFHKGLLPVLSFVTYFFRTMEGHFVRANFGFGFGAVFLMAAACFILRAQERKGVFESLKPTLGRQFMLFTVPSLAWWAVFPNQSASFFNSAMHAFPFVALAFGHAMDSSLTALENPGSTRTLKTGAVIVIIGSCWSPLLFTGKYLKEYPNLLDPARRINQSFSDDPYLMNSVQLEALARMMEAVKKATRFGDIVLAPDVFKTEHHFYEYYAQRRMDDYGGETVEKFKDKIKDLDLYRAEGAKKFKIFNPGLKLFALADLRENSKIGKFLAGKYSGTPIGKDWMLYGLETAGKR